MKESSFYRTEARQMLKNNWVLASVVVLGFVILGEGPSHAVSVFSNMMTSRSFEHADPEVTLALAGVLLCLSPIVLLWAVFVSEPLKFVYYSIFLRMSRTGELDFSFMFDNLKSYIHDFKSYMNVVWAILYADLIVMAWVLVPFIFAGLFFFVASVGASVHIAVSIIVGFLAGAAYIAAIVLALMKGYSYSMVPYIKFDYPELSAQEVAGRSKEMMQGHRVRLFLLQLSFIGWFIVGLLTCCIGLYPVSAYIQTAQAAFYNDRRKEMESGVWGNGE